eukprot:TRINITY_DN30004_c0_g1_i1.p1 TRINITY_DN30004_c0_g1~~TRINITY_DN30004_c0_g1_i1.p1  ORF type:complete len:296 (-),score=43.35 TRINITY_DN30004_c0_g1_i1:164-1006(-)
MPAEQAMNGNPEMLYEYSVTLQFSVGSALLCDMLAVRAMCQKAVGCDSTDLYNPHVSVTGFFKATESEAALLCDETSRLLPVAPGESHGVRLGEILTTGDGHVLLDVTALGVAQFAKTLAVRASELGLLLRPKNVNHISLSAGRPVDEQHQVAELYRVFLGDRLRELPRGCCSMDLVVAKLERRSTVQMLREHGQAHVFSEIMRRPLNPPPVHRTSVPAKGPELMAAVRPVSTPMRKRCLTITIDELTPPDMSSTKLPGKETPVKLLKPGILNETGHGKQ